MVLLSERNGEDRRGVRVFDRIMIQDTLRDVVEGTTAYLRTSDPYFRLPTLFQAAGDQNRQNVE
jgi:hypothetical protein